MNKKEKQEYFYYMKEQNHKIILDKICNKSKKNKSKILKIVAMLLLTILGTMGIGIAATQIYNKYVKKDDNIELGRLLEVRYNDKGEIISDINYDEESGTYYKIITEEQEYKKCKVNVKELPEISEIDFNQNFVILIRVQNININADVTISDINADNKTMYVALNVKENQNFERFHTDIVAIGNKSLLRNNIKIKIDTSIYKIPNITPISELPKDYSKEQAIKDGCVVVEYQEEKEKHVILSDNEYLLDELVENSEKGINSYVRIYYTTVFHKRSIIWMEDIQYKDGIIILEQGRPGQECRMSTSKGEIRKKIEFINGTNPVDVSTPTLE